MHILNSHCWTHGHSFSLRWSCNQFTRACSLQWTCGPLPADKFFNHRTGTEFFSQDSFSGFVSRACFYRAIPLTVNDAWYVEKYVSFESCAEFILWIGTICCVTCQETLNLHEVSCLILCGCVFTHDLKTGTWDFYVVLEEGNLYVPMKTFLAVLEKRFYNSAVTKPIGRVWSHHGTNICSHLRRLPVQSHNSFPDQIQVLKSRVSQEPFLFSVRTLSSTRSLHPTGRMWGSWTQSCWRWQFLTERERGANLLKVVKMSRKLVASSLKFPFEKKSQNLSPWHPCVPFSSFWARGSLLDVSSTHLLPSVRVCVCVWLWVWVWVGVFRSVDLPGWVSHLEKKFCSEFGFDHPLQTSFSELSGWLSSRGGGGSRNHAFLGSAFLLPQFTRRLGERWPQACRWAVPKTFFGVFTRASNICVHDFPPWLHKTRLCCSYILKKVLHWGSSTWLQTQRLTLLCPRHSVEARA